jgi:hypothetical protein
LYAAYGYPHFEFIFTPSEFHVRFAGDRSVSYARSTKEQYKRTALVIVE